MDLGRLWIASEADWDAVEEALATLPAGGGPPRPGHPLAALADAPALLAMRRAASTSRGRPARREGTVVVLHDLFGAHLAVPAEGGAAQVVWLDLDRIVAGEIERLRLDADGVGGAIVEPRLAALAYAPLVLRLRRRWRVRPFAYDWRRSVEDAAGALAPLVERCLDEGPVHLVAHGLGGLVCRSLLAQPRGAALWARMAQRGGGRLALLGAPLAGCYDAIAALSGASALLRWLAALDSRHDAATIAGVLRTFPALYELLPAPARLAQAERAIYEPTAWGEIRVSEAHLRAARDMHERLARAPLLDPARVACVVGLGTPTRCGVEIRGPGLFQLAIGRDGDGVVPRHLAAAEGVPLLEARAPHAALVQDATVLEAVAEWLESGHTARLPAGRAGRSVEPEGPADHHSAVRVQQIEARLEAFAQQLADRVAGAPRPAEEQHAVVRAEEGLMQAALGQGDLAAELLGRAVAFGVRASAPPRLRFRPVYGDLTQVEADVVVVGHYQGVLPAGSEGAIDRALGYWITRAMVHRLLASELGETIFIPFTRDQLGADAVLLVGKGSSGQLGVDDLRYMMTNVAYAVRSLGKGRIATVTMGRGRNQLQSDTSLRAMVEGLGEGLRRCARDTGQEPALEVTLVEQQAGRCEAVADALRALADADAELGIDAVEAVERRDADARASAPPPPRPAELPDEEDDSALRMTVEQASTGSLEVLRLSALTRTASVPQREVEVQAGLARDIAARLVSAKMHEDQERYGRLLCNILIPADLQKAIAERCTLTLVVDPWTAALPWEMACLEGVAGPQVLGIAHRLTRQLRTRLSPAPGLPRPLGRRMRALVIADPAPGALALPGAREEGEAIVDLLENLHSKRKSQPPVAEGGPPPDADIDVEVVHCIGPDECDPVDLLALLLDEEFDLIHYTGHGTIDRARPGSSGWVLRDGCVLSAREMFKARRVPRLVFANACWTSAIAGPDGAAGSVEVAGLAEAFFGLGVENYIGAAWPVDDFAAAGFGRAFYAEVLAGRTLGEALQTARRLTRKEDGVSWGAFQHYGQASARLTLGSREAD